MNAVVYARFSSHRQGEQSIEGQVAEAQRFAAAHGLTIVKVYADRAQTGRNDNREQFQLMLADAAKHAFDALIVWKTDRIGRNKEEIALNKYHLKKNGVKIYYVAEAIPDTPEGIILEAVIEGMAAYYSEQLSQNVRRGMKTSAQKGRYTGGTCPLGYRITADKRYEIDPKHAPTVREIFHLYAEGKTVTEIITILNNRGLRTARGQLFTHNSLRTLLKNKKYIGTFEYKDEVTIENSVPPIVEPEVFHRVQELLAINKKAAGHKKAKVDYLLFGKIFCGKCGAHMTGVCGTSKQHVKHHYYICSAKKKKLCTKRAVRQDWIEHLVLKHLRNLVRSEELLEFIAESTYQYYVAQNSDTSYTDSLQTALAETEKSIANLLRAIEAGIFNESTKDRMNELEEQKKELRVALAAAKLKEELGLKKEHIRFFLHQFADMDYTDIDCQKRLIKIFLNSVFVYDDKVVLTFNYSEDGKILTLHEIDGGSGHSIRIPSGLVHHEKTRSCFRRSAFFYHELCGNLPLVPERSPQDCETEPGYLQARCGTFITVPLADPEFSMFPTIYISTPASCCGSRGLGYLWSAFFSTGVMARATAPPMRAVKSWGQLKVAGSALSMGAFSAPEASRPSDRTPQMSPTTMAYRAANLAAAAQSHAMTCRTKLLPDLSASSASSSTYTQLPAMMAGTVRIWGAMPSRKASTGEHRATTRPLLSPPTRAATARMALTQEPVTS